MNQSTRDVIVEAVGGVGMITLNRPHAINALTPGMCGTILAALDAWAADDTVDTVELHGAGERGLCAGADVRALREVVLAGGDYMAFFDVEYAMNARIAGYPKPYVAHMRGIVMGGGLGLSAHGSRRIVYADSRLAMPETIIGFLPDVGVLWQLSRAPGELGTHLALTGATIGATDAVLVGLADEVADAAPAGVLAGMRDWVDACYRGSDPVLILRRLEARPEAEARAAASDLRQRCPLSVAVTLEALRRAASMGSVAEVLAQDHVVARHLVGGPDFVEGVRAQLVDKDRAPRWRHARLEDVTPADVLACFA